MIALVLTGLVLLTLALASYEPVVVKSPAPVVVAAEAAPEGVTPIVAEPEVSEESEPEAPAVFEGPPAPTTLHAALLAEDIPTLERLLASGSPLEIRDAQHRTPLMWAVQLGDAEAVERLLAQGADPDANDPFGDTALTWAVVQRRLDLVDLLLAQGADPDKGHLTPLLWAALQNELPELPEYTRSMIKALEVAIAEHLRERRRG